MFAMQNSERKPAFNDAMAGLGDYIKAESAYVKKLPPKRTETEYGPEF